MSLRVGLIGHKFMGRTHTHAYTDLPIFADLKVRIDKAVLCARSPEAKTIAEEWGWQSWTPDWHDVVNDPSIDIVDIAAPSIIHAKIAIEAARQGKHILCEKPLALTLGDARAMLSAVQESGVVNMVGFNYRCVPAVEYAKQMIRDGTLGEILHFRGIYQQDWLTDPRYPVVWRLQRASAGYGALGDTASHVLDVLRFWLGEVEEIICDQRTFYPKRPRALASFGVKAESGQEMQDVDVDDASCMLIRMRDHACLGYVEATRNGTGHKNQNRIEVNGSKGSIIFDMENLNVLQYYAVDDREDQRGFRSIQISEPFHPYMQKWWGAGHIIGYGDTFIHQAYNFVNAICENRKATPDFEDGYCCQVLLEAAQRSFNQHRWVKISEIDNLL